MTVIYILYYILAYIQHNGNVSLDKKGIHFFIVTYIFRLSSLEYFIFKIFLSKV